MMSHSLRILAVAIAALLVSGTSAYAQDQPAPYSEFIRQIDGVWPAHVDVTDDGKIWIHDILERRVRLFDVEGNEHMFGSTGAPWFHLEANRLKEFELPKDASLALKPRLVSLDVTDDLRMVLVDAANHRIVCVDLKDNNKQLWSVGGLGSFAGQFIEPTAVACVPGANVILVTDAQNHRAQAFNTDGEYLYEWGKHALVPREGEGKIHYPNDIAVAPDGSFVVVAEMFERRVQIFGPRPRNGGMSDERPAKTVPEVQTHFGDVMAVDGRLCAVWEPEQRRVLVFDMGRAVPIHVTTFGEYGTKLGQFTDITGLAIDEAKRTIYVLDAGTERIDVVELTFDPEAPPKFDPLMAKFVRSIPISNILPEDVKDPELAGLSLLTETDLAIVDPRNGRIHEITTDGALRTSWVVSHHDGAVARPIAVAVDPRSGRYLIVDDAKRCVLVYSVARAYETVVLAASLYSTGLKLPRDVCVQGDGSFYVVDAAADQVLKYDHTGGFHLPYIGSTGTKEGELWMPSAIGIDGRGRIVVLDFGNHRGQLFSQDGEWLATFSAGKARTRRLTPGTGSDGGSKAD